jgi:hypothetical protein
MGSGIRGALSRCRLVLLEAGVRLLRKILAAALYIAGAVAVLFVYYQDQASLANSMVVWRYFYLFWIGVALVAAAALLWPKPNRSHATEEEAP